ncbi:peptidoglycan DD-metalloendopeptidase family protein [Burkholderia sp. WAC0059]|uniref:peptidoglycan DD-metalloendopeptidase family protein n=1 Tax=Burkholderia sp. WAC0059 TaxID=2066022 RepID=UPI002155D1F0|nr:peptidoglycan DD-metalloendopeptidase family protein [Burkholderia sp. WAC0059]
MAALLGGCANLAPQGPQPGPQPDQQAAAGQTAPAAGGSGAQPQASRTPSSTDVAQAPEQDAAQPVETTRVVVQTTWYRVRRGESLRHFAQTHGCSVRDLLAWNHLRSSSRLRAGERLRIVSRKTVTVQAAAPAAGNDGAGGATASAAEVRQVSAEVARHASDVSLVWPAQGQVVQPFEPGENRGIEIAGNAGDPVFAAADGRVMYAGTGLNDYGSLIIVQHNKDFLTAYSHNRKLLVKTGDFVRQGQEIAEMGNEDNSRVAVVFELRHDGKPIDPMPYLPQRNG